MGKDVASRRGEEAYGIHFSTSLEKKIQACFEKMGLGCVNLAYAQSADPPSATRMVPRSKDVQSNFREERERCKFVNFHPSVVVAAVLVGHGLAAVHLAYRARAGIPLGIVL